MSLLGAAMTGGMQTVVNCFAVAGAFLVGNYGMGMCLKVMGKFVWKKPLPKWAGPWCRFLFGVLCAILAALILFGDGGFGLGGSGGGRPGGPQATERKEGKEDPKPDEKKETVVPPVEPEAVRSENRVRIVVLAGDDKQDRYYVVDDAKDPVAFEQLKDMLLARRQEEKKPLQRIDILVYKDSAYRESQLVKRLEAWAKEHKLSVNYPPVSGEMMPKR